MKFLMTSAFALASFLLFSQSPDKTLINVKWIETTGLPGALNWSASVSNTAGETYIAGNTQTFAEGTNLLLSKYDSNGNQLWEIDWNHANDDDDYGSSLVLDSNGDVIVGGASFVSTQNDYDFTLLKYSSSGTLIWERHFNGPGSTQDAITAVAVDSSDNIYLVGGSAGLTSGLDYSVQKYSSSGTFLWESRYDYAGYSDVPVDLIVVAGKPVVTGGSGDSWTNWDFATVKYDTNGNQLAAKRSSNAGLGYDQPYDIAKDSQGNVFVCGQYFNAQGDADIKVIKLDDELDEVWTYSQNYAGNDDEARGLTIDENDEVFVTGSRQDSLGNAHLFICHLNTAGVESWSSEFQTGSPLHESRGYRITSYDSTLIFTGTMNLGNTQNMITGSYSKTGNRLWAHEIENTIGDDAPWNVSVNTDGNIVTTGVQAGNTGPTYILAKYQVRTVGKELNDTINPWYINDELIVHFHPDVLDSAFIHNRGLVFGTLDNVLTPSSFASFQSATTNDLEKLYARKLFRDLTPENDTSISRSGHPVPMPKFWTGFVVEFPDGITEPSVISEWNNLSSIVRRVEYNILAEPLWCETNQDPDVISFGEDNFNYLIYSDDRLPEQLSLHADGIDEPINIEIFDSWCFEVGEPFIRTGVIDEVINYKHPDFSVDGSNTLDGSKVKGRNYLIDGPNNDLSTVTDEMLEANTHGTSVAGIIGALRNNNEGVSGIAGGDSRAWEVDNIGSYPGLQTSPTSIGTELYSFVVGGSEPLWDMELVVQAVVEGVSNDTENGWGDAIHILNNSFKFLDGNGSNFSWPWRLDDNSVIHSIGEVYKYAWRNEVVCPAARGNDGTQDARYPPCLNDGWIINVGASGISNANVIGELHELGGFDSQYGKDMDLIAPGIPNYVFTTGYQNQNDLYQTFGGTSAAAPHVAGVTALILSYVNSDQSVSSNFSPEDVEHLLETYADDRGPTGWDIKNSNGHLDCDAVFSNIDSDTYIVQHYNASSASHTLVEEDISLELRQSFDPVDQDIFLDQGDYKVNVHKVTAITNFSSPTDYVFKDGWVRSSTSTPWQFYHEEGFDKYLFPDQEIYLEDMYLGYAEMYGYVYNIVQDNNGNTVDYWLPHDLNSAFNFEYTVHLEYDPVNTITDQESNLDIHLYPNPVNEFLQVVTNDNGTFEYLVLDNVGRQVLQGRLGSTLKVSSLESGLYYLCLEDTEGNKEVKKFIKQ
jgi:hypothetical protein